MNGAAALPAPLKLAAGTAENRAAMVEHLQQPIADAPDDDAQQRRWIALRRAPRESDRALTGSTRQWLRRLPPRRRPLRLSVDFPRVANRIAWCWNDSRLAEQLLLDLLIDRRGGRQGFPLAVVRELQRLREFHAQQHVGARPEVGSDEPVSLPTG